VRRAWQLDSGGVGSNRGTGAATRLCVVVGVDTDAELVSHVESVPLLTVGLTALCPHGGSRAPLAGRSLAGWAAASICGVDESRPGYGWPRCRLGRRGATVRTAMSCRAGGFVVARKRAAHRLW
jgi:hypothetical protein